MEQPKQLEKKVTQAEKRLIAERVRRLVTHGPHGSSTFTCAQNSCTYPACPCGTKC